MLLRKLSIVIILLVLLVALASTAAASPAADATVWSAEYFNNLTLAGPPALLRGDGNLDFAWGAGVSPAPGYVGATNYSVRWIRELNFNATGNWVVSTLNDDGMRVWVDDRIAMDAWYDQGPTNHEGKIYLTAGLHLVKVEYYNRTMGGTARVSFALEGSTGPAGAWHGQYYNNISLSGTPVLVRDDPSLHFIWKTGSPGPGVPADYFSAKWDSVQVLPVTGNYTVLVSSDDGVRVWIDGTLVIDAWYDHSAALFTATRWLAAGAHNVHVEYYDRTFDGMVGVDITPGSTPPPAPSPKTEVVVDDGSNAGWQKGGTAAYWHTSWSGIGGHALWTKTNAYSISDYNWARWYPGLPGAGNYEVLAYIPGGLATTTNARYWIYHNGRFDQAARSQAFHDNQWISLGTYYFRGSGDEYVSLSDVTYECYACRTIVFDAVKFSAR